MRTCVADRPDRPDTARRTYYIRVVFRTTAARPISPVPISISRPDSGRVARPNSGRVPMAPRGCVIATGAGAGIAGSADTAAPTGSSAAVSNPIDIATLCIARIFTSTLRLDSIVRSMRANGSVERSWFKRNAT